MKHIELVLVPHACYDLIHLASTARGKKNTPAAHPPFPYLPLTPTTYFPGNFYKNCGGFENRSISPVYEMRNNCSGYINVDRKVLPRWLNTGREISPKSLFIIRGAHRDHPHAVAADGRGGPILGFSHKTLPCHRYPASQTQEFQPGSQTHIARRSKSVYKKYTGKPAIDSLWVYTCM